MMMMSTSTNSHTCDLPHPEPELHFIPIHEPVHVPVHLPVHEPHHHHSHHHHEDGYSASTNQQVANAKSSVPRSKSNGQILPQLLPKEPKTLVTGQGSMDKKAAATEAIEKAVKSHF